MKKLILYLIICVTSFSIKAQDKSLPNITIKDLNGSNFNIQDIANYDTPVVLSIWATWCKPCKNELNNINEVYAEWKEETGVEIFIVSIDDSRSSSKVKPYITTMGWEFTSLIDQNKELTRALNVTTIPHTFLIKEGKIIYEHRGYIEGDEDKLYEKIILIK
tara:strand:+ start:284 stop:769 length:486 start_codon:yes stop_codon:yes gene_type:complete